MRTLMQTKQQTDLVITLGSSSNKIFCLLETTILDVRSTVRLTSPSNPSPKFHLRLSWDPNGVAASQADVGVVLNRRNEAAMSDWITLNSRLCALRLRERKGGLVVISAYTPTVCSPNTAKDAFCHQLHVL